MELFLPYIFSDLPYDSLNDNELLDPVDIQISLGSMDTEFLSMLMVYSGEIMVIQMHNDL